MAKTLLTFDVGNTNISIGVMQDTKVIASFRLMTKTERTSDELGMIVCDLLQRANISIDEIDDVMISSVVPKIMHALTSCIKKYLLKSPLLVDWQMDTGIVLKGDNPKAVGADRIVDCAYAFHTFKRSCIVVDFGTATTFDYVSAKGEFEYTVIAPGLGISASALTNQTAKLPEVEITKPQSILATNTIAGIQAGVVYGYIGTVEYILRRMKQELHDEDCYVIATGGLGKIIAKETKEIHLYNPNVAYEGMNILYHRYLQSQSTKHQ